MQLKTELQAFAAKIDLPLLDSVVAFVLDTAEATRDQRAELRRRCPFLTMEAAASAFQQKYGFLYLGELLERYEERFGMTVQELRAIALALAYTRELATDTMFVGSQRRDFLRKVREAASGDIFLSGALYLLDEGRDGAAERGQALTGADFASTEDLLFVLGLFRDREQAFPRFRPQLLRLLGKNRTMPVLGNATALDWLIGWLAPQIKSARGKDMALFRAICALPTSHVKPDGKPHGVLLEHGWTPLEIAYANMMAVLARAAPDALRTDSIVSEKIAIDLFQEALASDAPFAPETYEQLSAIYRLYEKFSIRCYGYERLLQVLEPDARIRNADTFLWFSTLAKIHSPVFSGFDIMEPKWDALASAVTSEQYRHMFAACLDEDGGFGKRAMIDHIWYYVRDIRTPQAFRFFDQFFTEYDIEDLERFFGGRRSSFPDALTKTRRYSNDPVILDLHRDFLDDDGHRLLLMWLEWKYYRDKCSIACRIVREDLDRLLEA